MFSVALLGSDGNERNSDAIQFRIGWRGGTTLRWFDPYVSVAGGGDVFFETEEKKNFWDYFFGDQAVLQIETGIRWLKTDWFHAVTFGRYSFTSDGRDSDYGIMGIGVTYEFGR